MRGSRNQKVQVEGILASLALDISHNLLDLKNHSGCLVIGPLIALNYLFEIGYCALQRV